jgi:hypothetical protein
MLGVGALLVGRGTASYRIWDGIRSLDYLASRPEVDAKRLGCTGVSGGGTLTSYLMALDERIVCAAPSCYLTSLERLFATIGPQDGEQNITGQVAFGMDHADYITMRAPRPTLVLCATKDFFDIQGTWTSFREAKQVYGILGRPECVDIAENNAGHGYPKQQREAMVRWMRRWLLSKDDPVTEPEFTVYKTAELQCTRTGQVLEDFKGKSVVDLNVEREKELVAERKKAWSGMDRSSRIDTVRRTIGLPAEIRAAKRTVVSTVKREEFIIEKVTYETEPGIIVPAVEFSKTETPDTAWIYVQPGGKETEAGLGQQIERLARMGYRVISLDLRGVGETAPAKAAPGKPSHFGVDITESFLGLHLNRPLLGQRTYDLLSVLKTVGPNHHTIHLHGVGECCPVVLHAGALAPSLAKVTPNFLDLSNPLVSWTAVVRTPVSVNQLTNVVPGALAVYDLPDLGILCTSSNLIIENAVDASGKPVKKADLESAYAEAKAAYKKGERTKLILNQP